MLLGINTWGLKSKENIETNMCHYQVLKWTWILYPFPRCSEHSVLVRIEGRVFERRVYVASS